MFLSPQTAHPRWGKRIRNGFCGSGNPSRQVAAHSFILGGRRHLESVTPDQHLVALILHWIEGKAGARFWWLGSVENPYSLRRRNVRLVGQVWLQSDQSGRAQWGPLKRRKNVGKLPKGRRGCNFAKMVMCCCMYVQCYSNSFPPPRSWTSGPLQNGRCEEPLRTP